MASLLSKVSRKQLLIGVSGLVLLFAGAYNYYTIRVLSFSKSPESAAMVQGDNPTQIMIPSIKIDIPVEPASIENGVWEISYKNATFLDSSARPGTGGNVVIYGHNKKAIFGNLPYLSIGQKVYVKTSNGEIRVYEVYKKEFVAADRVDLVSPTSYEELTLYTCWGLFDSQRVVIKAKPTT